MATRSSKPAPSWRTPGQLPSAALEWTVCEVRGWTGQCVRLVAGGMRLEARCADGLILQPAVGDSVVAAMVDGEWRVLLVLDRKASAAPAVLAVPRAPSLRIEAPTLSLSSDHLEVHARHTTARLGLVRLSAQVLRMAAQRIAVWADSLHTRARAVALRADMRLVRVDGSDVLHAGQALTEVDGLVRLQGGQVQMAAKDNVLIDGKRISLG